MEYDPNIGCTNPRCIQRKLEEEIQRWENAEERKEAENEKRRRLKEAFDRIIWLGNIL
jgi:hypothetical protein